MIGRFLVRSIALFSDFTVAILPLFNLSGAVLVEPGDLLVIFVAN